MRRMLARCPNCKYILMEREQYCRNCHSSVERIDKQHMLVNHTP